MKGDPNLAGAEHQEERQGSYPEIFSLKTVYETGLNIKLDTLHPTFPLSSCFYPNSKTREIKLNTFCKKKNAPINEILINN